MSTFANQPHGTLPDKEPGHHRWVAVVSYSLSDEEAKAAVEGGEPVLLDAAHLFTPVEVGCLDCEERYEDVVGTLCTAGDDWSVLVGPPDELEREIVMAGVEVIGRTGATDFEVGHVLEGVPSVEADWYAHADFGGVRVQAEHHTGPAEAVDALARRLLAGGRCTHCQRTIRLDGGNSKDVCVWWRDGVRWVRGCEEQ